MGKRELDVLITYARVRSSYAAMRNRTRHGLRELFRNCRSYERLFLNCRCSLKISPEIKHLRAGILLYIVVF